MTLAWGQSEPAVGSPAAGPAAEKCLGSSVQDSQGRWTACVGEAKSYCPDLEPEGPQKEVTAGPPEWSVPEPCMDTPAEEGQASVTSPPQLCSLVGASPLVQGLVTTVPALCSLGPQASTRPQLQTSPSVPRSLPSISISPFSVQQGRLSSQKEKLKMGGLQQPIEPTSRAWDTRGVTEVPRGDGAGRSLEEAANGPGRSSWHLPIPGLENRSFLGTEPQSSDAGRSGDMAHLEAKGTGMAPILSTKGSACTRGSVSPEAPIPANPVLSSPWPGPWTHVPTLLPWL